MSSMWGWSHYAGACCKKYVEMVPSKRNIDMSSIYICLIHVYPIFSVQNGTLRECAYFCHQNILMMGAVTQFPV